jgi:hypothetical protein
LALTYLVNLSILSRETFSKVTFSDMSVDSLIVAESRLQSQTVILGACSSDNRIGKGVMVPDLMSMDDGELWSPKKTQHSAEHFWPDEGRVVSMDDQLPIGFSSLSVMPMPRGNLGQDFIHVVTCVKGASLQQSVDHMKLR